MSLLIVTPTLGCSPFWRQTLDSIAGLGIPYRHCIVCPRQVRARIATECPDAIVIAESPERAGLYAAVNQGVAAVTGENWEWMTYINDDDLLSSGVSTCLNQVTADVDLCYGRVDKIDESGRRLEAISTLRSEKDFLYLAAAGISGFNQQGALLRRRLWEKVKPFDVRLKICADFDLFVRAALAGGKMKYFSVTTGAFRIRAGQISQDVPLELREKQEIHRRNDLGRFVGGAQRVRWRFRIQNCGTYWRRMLRGRFYTSHQMLAGERR